MVATLLPKTKGKSRFEIFPGIYRSGRKANPLVRYINFCDLIQNFLPTRIGLGWV
jgi:hypothetical protein